jgi:hypothetical protein
VNTIVFLREKKPSPGGWWVRGNLNKEKRYLLSNTKANIKAAEIS